MNLIVPILMLFVPGIIAVSVHNGRLIHVTRNNWQSMMWMYLLYSFAIIIIAYFVLFITDPPRTVSFSPWTTETTNDVLHVGFVFKYTLLAVTGAFILPKIRHVFTKRKTFKIADDE